MDDNIIIYLSLCNLIETLLSALEGDNISEIEKANYNTILEASNSLLDKYEKELVETPTTIQRPPWLKQT